ERARTRALRNDFPDVRRACGFVRIRVDSWLDALLVRPEFRCFALSSINRIGASRPAQVEPLPPCGRILAEILATELLQHFADMRMKPVRVLGTAVALDWIE